MMLSGFDSMLCWLAVSIVGPVCSHADTGLDPAMSSQIIGIHKAFEMRGFRSRSRMNNPMIPITARTVATVGVNASSEVLVTNGWSFRVDEQTVHEFQRQQLVDLVV